MNSPVYFGDITTGVVWFLPITQPIGLFSVVFWFFFCLASGFVLLDKMLLRFCKTDTLVLFALVLLILPVTLLFLICQHAKYPFAPLNVIPFTLIGSIDSCSLLFVFMVHIVGCMVLFFLIVYSLPCTSTQSLLALRTQLFATFVMILLLDVLFMSTNFIIMFFAAEFSLFPLSFLLLKDNVVFWRSPQICNDSVSIGFLERQFESKRPLAFYYLIMFTVISGGFGLLGFTTLYLLFGDLSFPVLTNLNTVIESLTFRELPANTLYSLHTACVLVLLWIVVKVPLVPVHVWLPKAHVEGSTESSMLLAGIILKITTYVLIRLSALVFFQWLFVPFEIFFLTLALSTAVFGALGALSTTDLKKLAAYSSVSHMGIILVSGFLLGASSFSLQPYLILLMTHTFISTAMFMVIGCIYKNRTGGFISRNRLSYSGLLYSYPFLFLFGLILFANLNIPLTLGFIGELGVFASSAQLGFSTILFLLIGSFILLLPILMVIAQVLMGPFRGFDYTFNQLIFNSEFNGIRLYSQTRVFDHVSFSKNYIVAYSRLKSFFGSISCSIIGFGLLPITFARFCNNYVILYPTFMFLN